MPNISVTPRTRFEIDPGAHIALRRALRGQSPAVEIVGVYHSHPQGAPVLSARDIAEANYPSWVHVVIGSGGGRARMRAYRLLLGVARPVTIVTI